MWFRITHPDRGHLLIIYFLPESFLPLLVHLIFMEQPLLPQWKSRVLDLSSTPQAPAPDVGL
jgi:hypothetical protein